MKKKTTYPNVYKKLLSYTKKKNSLATNLDSQHRHYRQLKRVAYLQV